MTDEPEVVRAAFVTAGATLVAAGYPFGWLLVAYALCSE